MLAGDRNCSDSDADYLLPPFRSFEWWRSINDTNRSGNNAAYFGFFVMCYLWRTYVLPTVPVYFYVLNLRDLQIYQNCEKLPENCRLQRENVDFSSVTYSDKRNCLKWGLSLWFMAPELVQNSMVPKPPKWLKWLWVKYLSKRLSWNLAHLHIRSSFCQDEF